MAIAGISLRFQHACLWFAAYRYRYRKGMTLDIHVSRYQSR